MPGSGWLFAALGRAYDRLHCSQVGFLVVIGNPQVVNLNLCVCDVAVASLLRKASVSGDSTTT